MLKIDVTGIIDKDLEVFKDLIPYVSPKVGSVSIEDNLIVVDAVGDSEEEIKEHIYELKNMLGNSLIRGDENLETKILEDFSDRNTINNRNVFEQLKNEKCVRELSPGSFAYSGIYLKIIKYFEKKITEFAFEEFEEINEERYPSLFPVKEYVKGGYFDTFPHYMMFQTKFNNDINIYKNFNKKNNIELNDIKPPVNVLRHAACAPLYPSLENEIIESSEVRSYLVSGTCYRNEETNIKELSRLNEFKMKEYVFIGDSEQISSYAERASKLILFWIDKFSLNAKVETANDSFFANNYKKLKYFQLIGNSKKEYKLYIPESEDYISCCSTNYHRTHFTKPYNIKNSEDEYCYSACHAFGVDRLAYAFLSQKGIDVGKWDEDTKLEIMKYINI